MVTNILIWYNYNNNKMIKLAKVVREFLYIKIIK